MSAAGDEGPHGQHLTCGATSATPSWNHLGAFSRRILEDKLRRYTLAELAQAAEAALAADDGAAARAAFKVALG